MSEKRIIHLLTEANRIIDKFPTTPEQYTTPATEWLSSGEAEWVLFLIRELGNEFDEYDEFNPICRSWALLIKVEDNIKSSFEDLI